MVCRNWRWTPGSGEQAVYDGKPRAIQGAIAFEQLQLYRYLVSIESLVAAQAVDLRQSPKPGSGSCAAQFGECKPTLLPSVSSRRPK